MNTSVKSMSLVLFSALLVCLTDRTLEVEAADDVGDLRLFFTASERQRIDSKEGVQALLPESQNITLEPSLPAKSREGHSRARSLLAPSSDSARVGRESKSKSHRVYFTGLVSSSKGISVLVNGLPCRVEKNALDDTQNIELDCPALEQPSLSLSLRRKSEVLVVADRTGVRLLEPGQGL